MKYGGKTLKKGTDYTVSYKNNKSAGTASVIIRGKGAYGGSITKTFRINKAANPMKVSAKKVSVKYNRKKSQSIAASKIYSFSKKAAGSVSYKKAGGNKKISVASNGRITVPVGMKKGKTYKVQVNVKAKGNGNYKAKSQKVTAAVRLK